MSSRLVVVSNRLPVSITQEYGTTRVNRSSGGLVSALETVMEKTNGVWIGWPGSELNRDTLRQLQEHKTSGYRLVPVSLSKDEVEEYYNGFSNAVLWPLFHGFPSECRFNASFWETYLQVNERFADFIRTTATPRDVVWVQDYHLMGIASALVDKECRLKLGYFHHIPFPEPETFGKLPWRKEILSGLLDFNLVGFQTIEDKRNFVAALKRYLPVKTTVRRIGSAHLVSARGTHSIVGTFPISIDFERFNECPSELFDEVTKIRNQFRGQKILLGVDRLDYTKGIVERLSAFELLLQRNPELRGSLQLIQVVVPSRENIGSYSALREEVERCVSRINGEFGTVGWLPITYLYRQLTPRELQTFYRAADVALVTPLRDGMNLVAKEFCASRQDEQGVLILSEFAGAVRELSMGALVTNPYDTAQTAATMHVALNMPAHECSRRMCLMREQIRAHDIWRWSAGFRKQQYVGATPIHVKHALKSFAIEAAG